MGRGRPEVRSSAPAQGPGSPRRWPLPPSSSPCVAGQGGVPRRGGREARCVCLFPSEPGSMRVLLGLWPCGRLVSEHQFLGVCLGPCVCVAVSSRLSFLASLHRSLPHSDPHLWSTAAPTTAHLGGAHSSAPAASSPTRPGLSAGFGDAQSSRLARLSSSVKFPGPRVELSCSAVEVSRASMSRESQSTLGLPGDPPWGAPASGWGPGSSEPG